MSVTYKAVKSLRWPSIACKVRALLARQGISEERVEPATDATDWEVHLTGEYKGVWVQVGDGYVTACAWADDDGLYMVDVTPKQDLKAALSKALALRNGGAK